MARRKPGLVTVALCLGGALTACGIGGDGDDGYAPLGAGPGRHGTVTPSGAAPPGGPAALPTLASSTRSPSPAPASASSGTDTGTATGPRTGPGAGTGGGTGSDVYGGTEPGTPPGTAPAPGPSRTDTATAPPRTPPRSAPGTSGPGTGPRPVPPPAGTAPRPTTPPTPPPSPTPAPAPAALTVSVPVLADTDRRWCERVTVTFRNTGGTPVVAGTVTFATHVIGALGLDWGTVTGSRPLPAPIAAGAARTETYTVCVESWRVPPGTRVDTREVGATWR
ncbi:hypothetical protein [Streptomyces sp. NPDC126503]|uniref:hypothetical protein n=1 Tax=Streptomyces sp. NPDC126503 TaxID=3155315 RepID=UPI00331681C0